MVIAERTVGNMTGTQLQPEGDESVGDRLVRLRRDRGMTQRDLAAPRYSPAFVSTVESGRRRPSEEALRYFAERLQVDSEELRTGRPAHADVSLYLRLNEARHAVSSGDLTDADQGYQAVLDAARRHGLCRLEAGALEGLALCAKRAGDHAKAVARYDEAAALLVDEPITAQVPMVVGKARIQRLNGELRDAAYALESTLDRLNREGLPDPSAVLQLHYGLVGVYVDLGLLDRAAAAADTAIALAGEGADPEHVAAMHVQVSRTYMTRGRWADAEAALEAAHATYRRLDYALETGLCHWARGYILSRHGRLADAERELVTARDLMRSLDAWHYCGSLASELAMALWKQGRGQDALAALEDAWRLERESPTTTLPLADAHHVRGLIARGAGDTAVAEEALREALKLFRHADAGPDAARTAYVLGDLLHDRGNDTEAIAVYRDGLAAVVADRDGLADSSQ